MGYRISLYRCPKEDVDAIRDITNEDVINSDYEIFNVLEKDQIKYDTLANVLDTGTEEEDGFCSRIFNNRLDIEDDCSYYTISKEQLKKIIERIRQFNIYEYMMDNSVDYDEKTVGNSLKEFSVEKLDYIPMDFDKATRKVCLEYRWDAQSWNMGYKDDDGEMKYFNIDLSDNKWWITNANSYKYAIFNFIHIYKCFDWEHDYLVALGG